MVFLTSTNINTLERRPVNMLFTLIQFDIDKEKRYKKKKTRKK